ncbi:alpha/beta hydrolase family protein [Paenibacillus eucommiae]|uniref:Dipeptidyl aminopeptidase/acylaminoacyl peptidase n=1 Tax=Paenibacillus eucommiae TaxID=1355755 RepID=A0ABS4J0K3_9BACL|nr:prolyl oligopeptidase family serine peptidase [Paenibacillus eucommiae]MBP1993367.1 dipeptidyl aminopeptidase/acylaminoacyl peptidase [Paenibacillus eucommiae]
MMSMPIETIQDGQILDKTAVRCYAKDVSLYIVTYSSQGLQVKGFLAVPEGVGPFPAIIYCRGGIRRVGMVRKRRVLSIARRGYVVFAPFYRGNEGGEGREDFCGEDRFDLYHALTLVHALPETLAEPIPLIGFSRGAMMALLAAKDCTGVGPVVVWGGVSDLLHTYEERVDLRRMLKRVVGNPHKQVEAYTDRSPVYWARGIQSPVLIVHGKQDEQVSISQAEKLASALEAAGKEYAMELFEGAGHRFSKEDEVEAMNVIFAWIEKKREMIRQKM